MTIDLQELYHAVLERNCKLKLVAVREVMGAMMYYIDIIEDNSVTYTVALCSDHNWSKL